MSYPFLTILEDNWEIILKELENILYNEAESGKAYFTPWHEKEIYDGDWDVFGLYAFGEKIDINCSFCPKTTEIVEQIPGLVTAGFSCMAPETHIKPHIGYTDEVLRCHLGLMVPERRSARYEGGTIPLVNCGLRVGEVLYTWTPGKAFVFDDTEEHEAYNYGDRSRFILLIDFKKEQN